ncbi:MAG: ribose transport system permease protein [Tepidanaerobacteraceae bacterium]|jgi:ribose transport system permease protein|nr:ribose transport system permease protein [Tepidanaerobacteraceae bacterium]MDK2879112.1 ribose transport system permease protein [Thermoanaerobacteraceae bacterium]
MLLKAGFSRGTMSDIGIIAALVVLCIIMAILSPTFLTVTNLLNILQQISIISIIAVGMTFVIILGGIDLSVGSLVALTGLVMAGLMKNEGVSVWLSIIIGLLCGCLLGLINGFNVAQIKLPPFIATLGMMSLARGAAFTISGGQPIYTLPKPFLEISGKIGIVPIPAIIMILVFLIAGYVLKYTKLGRYTYAIGGNETASILSGINVKLYKMIVYTISGLCCAISSVLLTAKLDSAVPVAADGYELDAIAAVVIGGTSMMGGEGKLLGTFIGALIIGVVNNGLNLLTVPQGPQRMVKGAIIIIAVAIDVIRKTRQSEK